MDWRSRQLRWRIRLAGWQLAVLRICPAGYELAARRIRLAGWLLVAILAVLALQRLGWQQLIHGTGAILHTLTEAVRLVLGAGWPALLLIAIGLVLGLALTGTNGQTRRSTIGTAARRLWATPVARLVRWLVAGAGLLALLVLVVAVLPPRFTAHRHFDKASEELKAQSDVRTTLVQVLAGALLAIGAYLTWRQLQVSRQGQITDRYTKAVEQVGHEELDVRLGGIYALERIARDSPQDRATIEEVLTAFVRGHAPWPPPSPASAQVAATQLPAGATQQSVSPAPPEAATDAATSDGALAMPPQRPPADVYAAVSVLGRRPLPPDGVRSLDLSGVDLRMAQLGTAKLESADLQRANLDHAELWSADLKYAALGYADLREAMLQDAKLQDAKLWGAKLEAADLQRADLRRAELQGANLEGANLQHANLQHANLGNANLQHANLEGANLQHANLRGTRANADTQWPEGWDQPQAEARGVHYVD